MKEPTFCPMIEIIYKDPDGGDYVFLTSNESLRNDPKLAAEEIAKENLSSRGGNLYDIDCWPRDYEVFIEGKWSSISVRMEYMPCFSAFVNKAKEVGEIRTQKN